MLTLVKSAFSQGCCWMQMMGQILPLEAFAYCQWTLLRDYTCVSREGRESVWFDTKLIHIQLQKEEMWKCTWKTSLWRRSGELTPFRKNKNRIDKSLLFADTENFQGGLMPNIFIFSFDRHKHIYCLWSCFSGRLGVPYVPSNRQFSPMAFIFLFHYLNFLSGLAC